MRKSVKGAWLVHHGRKLQNVANAVADYEQINFAGKCGALLNAMAASEQETLSRAEVEAMAKANGITVRLELSSVLEELVNQKLVDSSATGVEVLGLTTKQTLIHTATIFNEAGPPPHEKAAIAIAEKSSDLPVAEKTATEFVSDKFHLPTRRASEVVHQHMTIGFVDAAKVGDESLLFNGNLFRSDDMQKIAAVVGSLSSDDQRRLNEFSAMLASRGCVPLAEAEAVLGNVLYAKMKSIGFLDENTIGNETGMHSFVTRPASFCKFSKSNADDAFDLAKAFVSSLTFGMVSSSGWRGRITMVEKLMKALIRGQWVGSCDAIGQDYKVLELKRVVQVRREGGGGYSMKLLKKDVGQLALKVILDGEAASDSVLQFPGVSATEYQGPESNREIERKRQAPQLRQGVAEILDSLRTGGF